MSKTELEKCCDCFITMYHKYSVRTDHFDRLSLKEFKTMLEEQLPHYIEKPKDSAALKRLFDELDKNKDKEIDFEEWMGWVGKVLNAAHNHIHDDGHGHGHGHSHGPGHSH